MYFIVYKATNKINGMIYVGAHQTETIEDGYLGSGKYLKRAVNKYGNISFEREIIEYFTTSEDMYAHEKSIVDEKFVLRKDTYNIVIGGKGGKGGWELWNKNNMTSDTQKAANIKGQLAQRKLMEDPVWVEAKAKKLSIASRRFYDNGGKSQLTGQEFKGKHHTDETKKRMSDARKGRYTGKENPQFGKVWVNDGKISKMVMKDSIPRGFELGKVKHIKEDKEITCKCGKVFIQENQEKLCSTDCRKPDKGRLMDEKFEDIYLDYIDGLSLCKAFAKNEVVRCSTRYKTFRRMKEEKEANNGR